MMQPACGERMKAWLENAWMQHYLARELDDDDTAWFEAYLMDKADLVELIERDTALRDGVALARKKTGANVVELAVRLRQPARDNEDGDQESMETEAAKPRTVARSRGKLVTGGSGTGRRVTYLRTLGVAAILAAGVGIGWGGRRAAHPDAPAIVANPTRFVFDAERGTNTKARIDHSNSASPYVLIEAPVPPGAINVEFHIGDASNSVSPSADGFVSILVVRNELRSGTRATLRYDIGGTSRSSLLDFSDAQETNRR